MCTSFKTTLDDMEMNGQMVEGSFHVKSIYLQGSQGSHRFSLKFAKTDWSHEKSHSPNLSVTGLCDLGF